MLDHIASIDEYADVIQIAGEGLSGQKLFILKDPHIANMTIGALLKYQVMDEPLWIDALAAGSFQDLQILIFRGFDVNTKTKEGYSPLIIGSMLGRKEAVRLLIQNGADLKSDGPTAIKAAYDSGNIGVYDLLTTAGVSLDTKIDFDIGRIELPLPEIITDPSYNPSTDREHCKKIHCNGRIGPDLFCDKCGIYDYFHPSAEKKSRKFKYYQRRSEELAKDHAGLFMIAMVIELYEEKRKIFVQGMDSLKSGKFKRIALGCLQEGFKKFSDAMSTNHRSDDPSVLIYALRHLTNCMELSMQMEVHAQFTIGPEPYHEIFQTKLKGCPRQLLKLYDQYFKKISEFLKKPIPSNNLFALNVSTKQMESEYVKPLVEELQRISKEVPDVLSKYETEMEKDMSKKSETGCGCLLIALFFLLCLILFI